MRTQRKHMLVLIFTVLTMLVLILDTKTILLGIQEGVAISINTIIPSLFPFIFISTIMNNHLIGRRIPMIRPVSKLCKIPEGAESLLLLGLIGGYPVGAKIISDNYRIGQLEKKNAQRMLGFCNNAGPSFLIGMLGPMFSNATAPYILWIIHITSAILVGILLKAEPASTYTVETVEPIPLSKALETSLRTVAGICGWVTIFRGLIAVCEKWFLHLLPPTTSVLFTGILELSNGCIALANITDERIRFVLSSCMLAAGGLCVVMQSKSIVGELGLGLYLPGKLLQTAISLALSVLISLALYGWASFNIRSNLLILAASFVSLVIIFLYFYFSKKKDSIPQKNVV